jgi:sec-independent protein translocase protein TatC
MREEELKSMSLGDHLEELRARLILALVGLAVGLVVALFFGNAFLDLLLVPFKNAMIAAQAEPKLQALKVTETFTVFLKASFVLAVLITCPWIIYQFWAFVSAGLYKHERRFVYAVVPFCTILFVTGVVFFLFVVAPLALKFFLRFDVGQGDLVEYRPSITDYVNFILILSLVFGVTFQSPIVIVFAERMGLVSLETLTKSRKYVLLAIAIIAAVATPGPDVISQILLGIPLYILYEASIMICRVWRSKRQNKTE